LNNPSADSARAKSSFEPKGLCQRKALERGNWQGENWGTTVDGFGCPRTQGEGNLEIKRGGVRRTERPALTTKRYSPPLLNSFSRVGQEKGKRVRRVCREGSSNLGGLL